MSQGVGLIDFQSEYNEIDCSQRRSPLTVLSCTSLLGTFKANYS